MFTLNKNNALLASRQPSVDSLVTVPSSSTSASAHWVSQCSNTSSYEDLPSPERHAGTSAGRRNSVFNMRPRSNTATSTASSFVSVTPPSTAGHGSSSRRSSQDLRHLAGQSFMDLQSGRRSLFRGKKGKRSSGSFSPSFYSAEVEEADAGSKRTSVLRKNKKSNNQSERYTSDLKHRISSPFDFQHLTHTDRHQFAALQEASENELMVEFSAVRASQAPRRDLTGIKAEHLHFNNFSSERLATPESRSTSAFSYRSPPLSPNPPEHQHSVSRSEDPSMPTLRLTRSVESFSRPGVNLLSHRHTQSVMAPPRASSRLPLTPDSGSFEDTGTKQGHPHSPKTRSNRQSGMWDTLAPLSPGSTGGQLPTMVEESNCVGHALTTPDNSACHPTTPPFSPALEDVAEEPERFIDPRPAPPPPVGSIKSPRSPFFDSFAFSNERSPIAKSHNRKSSHTSPKTASQRNSITRPVSQMSDTLASPGLTRRSSIRRASAVQRNSNTWRVIEESWEDGIDYIYDNALEADCDFDWDRASMDDVFQDRDRTPEQQDHKRASTTSHDSQTPLLVSDEEPVLHSDFDPATVRPSLVVPSVSSVPELESRSANSTSTADTGVRTPSDLYIPPRQFPFTEADAFTLTPSLLIPREFKDVPREDAYADLLAEYEESDGQFPFLEPSQSVASSTRSSHVRSSKRSSYDSSLISSGPASGSWTFATRRSASSAGSHGSLPELVHSSRHARHDFTMMVDRLSEQVASFASFGKDIEEDEDEETTPPGHVSQDRTFFASDDEEPETDKGRISFEAEMRSSLELAQRGSTRSTRAPIHHKYASSDGAAKLLASSGQTTLESESSTNSRPRAATSSNVQRTNREQYLNLFPAPPMHSPLASPAARTNDRL